MIISCMPYSACCILVYISVMYLLWCWLGFTTVCNWFILTGISTCVWLIRRHSAGYSTCPHPFGEVHWHVCPWWNHSNFLYYESPFQVSIVPSPVAGFFPPAYVTPVTILPWAKQSWVEQYHLLLLHKFFYIKKL